MAKKKTQRKSRASKKKATTKRAKKSASRSTRKDAPSPDTVGRAHARPREPRLTDSLTGPQRKFLAAYRKLGVITYAARAAKVSRETHYHAQHTSEAYRQAFRDAHREAHDELEMEARVRATEGVKKLVLYKGQPVVVKDADGNEHYLYEFEKSDRLLIRLLEAGDPERYAKRTEVTGVGGGDVAVKIDVSRMPRDKRRDLAKSLREARVDGDG